MEALVGPMRQEREEEGAAAPPVAAGDGSLVLDGLTRLDEWEEATGIRLEESDHDAVDTVGGLVMTCLGRIPEVGDEIAVGGRTLRVEALDGLRVDSVRLLPADGDRTERQPPTSGAASGTHPGGGP